MVGSTQTVVITMYSAYQRHNDKNIVTGEPNITDPVTFLSSWKGSVVPGTNETNKMEYVPIKMESEDANAILLSFWDEQINWIEVEFDNNIVYGFRFNKKRLSHDKINKGLKPVNDHEVTNKKVTLKTRGIFGGDEREPSPSNFHTALKNSKHIVKLVCCSTNMGMVFTYKIT